jgi:hypothetical protein
VQITAVMETTKMNGTQVFRKPATLKKKERGTEKLYYKYLIQRHQNEVIKPIHNFLNKTIKK